MVIHGMRNWWTYTFFNEMIYSNDILLYSIWYQISCCSSVKSKCQKWPSDTLILGYFKFFWWFYPKRVDFEAIYQLDLLYGLVLNHEDRGYMQIVELWRLGRNDHRLLRGSEDHRKSRFVEIGTINLCQRKKYFHVCRSREAQEKTFTILWIGYEQTFWSLWFFITDIFHEHLRR